MIVRIDLPIISTAFELSVKHIQSKSECTFDISEYNLQNLEVILGGSNVNIQITSCQ